MKTISSHLFRLWININVWGDKYKYNKNVINFKQNITNKTWKCNKNVLKYFIPHDTKTLNYNIHNIGNRYGVRTKQWEGFGVEILAYITRRNVKKWIDKLDGFTIFGNFKPANKW